MLVSINNPIQATYIFIAIFTIILAVSVRKKKEAGFFPASLTQELKGVAILGVVFFHIGYYLSTDTRFLFPLSIIAGVGVNLFLFLSGYGLAMSSIKKNYSKPQFYQRRLSRLFVPLWIILAVFFALDFFFLKISYPPAYVLRSFLGFYPKANLYKDIDSPLWYFTFILFYYFIFPWLFSRKHPWISAVLIYLSTYLLVLWSPSWLGDGISFYKIHTIAFPLGVFFAGLSASDLSLEAAGVSIPACAREICNFFKLKQVGYYALMAASLAVFGYTAYYSNIGKGTLEELTSLLTVSGIVIFFLLKKFEFRFLYYIGFYSYEIYLFHWPILYRYDLLFRFLPGWLAMTIYLFLFLGLGWFLKKMTDKLMGLKLPGMGLGKEAPAKA